MSPQTRIVIVGGVAGGATAAARARRLSESATIVVFERGPYVSFANCGLPYHVGGEIADRGKLLLQTPESLHARHNLDVRVKSEVSAINRDRKTVSVRSVDTGREYEEPYDKLILATGAAPVRPPLPGIDHPRIFTLRTLPDMDRIKAAADAAKSAIVVGAGFIGLEMAENLRRRGLTVHLIELLDQVMPPLDREMAQPAEQMLRLQGIDLRLADAVEGFSDVAGKVSAKLKSGVELAADLVILSIGVRPETSLAQQAGLQIGDRGAIVVNEHMQTSDADIFAVGDSVLTQDFVNGGPTLIPLAGPANRQGRIAAENVLGRSTRYRGSQGTSIVRIFDLVVAMTGSSEKALRKAGANYEKIYVHPQQHAGYFPGAMQMSIKLLFRKPDGRVLGAQISGGEGVDKRIDVIATAIQARMTVFDLEEMELAYAPQFGSAKDPINMAGFVAANVLRGDVRLAQADSLDGALLLDVRTEAENRAGHISGATLIPIDELRRRASELPKDRPIVAYCAVGLRGYTASRILSQLGFDVRNLSGGFKTYRMFHPEAPAAPTAPSSPAPQEGQPNSCAAPTPQTAPNGAPEELDVRGQQCPGPIVAINSAVQRLAPGRLLRVRATDPGFVADIPAWCRQSGNELVELRPENGHFVAGIRKGPRETGAAAPPPAAATARDSTIVVFSSDFDRVMAAFVIANGAAAMGRKMTLFFTFWGLNVLRRPDVAAPGKPLMDRLFGWMMPRGPDKLPLSRMNMVGLGRTMMKQTMRSKHVATLPDLIQSAKQAGVRLVACAMSMDVMGIQRTELIEGVEIGGVGTYLDAASTSNLNLFI